MTLITLVLFAVLFLAMLENNLIFAIVFSPLVHVYMLMSRRRDQKLISYSNNKLGNNEKCPPQSGRPSVIVLYVTGFVRYYDNRVNRIPSHHIRHYIYRHIYLMKIAKSATIYYGAQIRKPFKIKIGPGTTIGDNAILDGRNGIEIGSNVNLSSNVSIWTEQHDHRDPWFRCETQIKDKVIIGDRAWLGPNTIVLHDVQIGEGAVVGAGAVVTKNVDDYAIVGGIPAKKIGERNHYLLYDNSSGIYNPFL